MIDRDAAEEFTQAQAQVWAGSVQTIAWAHRQGIPKALGMTTRQWVDERLGGFVRLGIPERREYVAELTDEGFTQREIADVLGVGQATVARDSNGSRADDVDEESQITAPTRPSGDSYESPSLFAEREPMTPEQIAEHERQIAERDAERIRRAGIERDADRLRRLVTAWPSMYGLRANPYRDAVLDSLVASDRDAVLDIERHHQWTT